MRVILFQNHFAALDREYAAFVSGGGCIGYAQDARTAAMGAGHGANEELYNQQGYSQRAYNTVKQ